MRAGDTFTFRDTSLDTHLWVVISDPHADVADPVVIVSFTSYREGKDATCLLEVGDHPFIRHRTAVHYIGALEVSGSGLDGRANRGDLVLQEPLRPDVLTRVRLGAAESPFVPEGCRRILAKQGLID